MKAMYFALVTIVIGLLLTACGGSTANNTTANANANKAAANTNAAAPADPKVAEAEVRKVMEAVKDGLSKNDADAMDKVYADNYMIVNSDGSTMTKAERLAAIHLLEPLPQIFSQLRYLNLKLLALRFQRLAQRRLHHCRRRLLEFQ